MEHFLQLDHTEDDFDDEIDSNVVDDVIDVNDDIDLEEVDRAAADCGDGSRCRARELKVGLVQTNLP